jgi:hypothetical protein
MNIFIEYPDAVKEVFIPVIIGLLTIALPLLIQSISRIDDKYYSTTLIRYFVKERITITLIIIQISSIVSIVIWSLNLPYTDSGNIFLDAIIGNSALLFIGFSTIVSIISYSRFIYLIVIYYIPDLLLNRLIKNHNKNKGAKKIETYLAITDILNYSIQKYDEKLLRILLSFIHESFIQFRLNKDEQIIIYPDEYYGLINSANEITCKMPEKINSYTNENFLSLFIDNFQNTKISYKTYNALWICLIQALKTNRDNIVISYWKSAHQYISIFRNREFERTDNNDLEKEKEEFLEFHYALGGMILYLKKYTLLKNLMNHSTSIPPSYYLVPETLVEVIFRYMKLGDYEHKPFNIESKYPFPDFPGVFQSGLIISSIKRYLGILFLRQYTLHGQYYGGNRLVLPNEPQNLGEKNRWKREFKQLSEIINEYLDPSNKNILDEVGLGIIKGRDWFSKNNYKSPEKLIYNKIFEIELNFKKTKTEQPINVDKNEIFIKSSNNSLKHVFKYFSSIENEEKISKNYNKYFLTGDNYQLLPKTAFSDNQDVSYVDFESSAGKSAAISYSYSMSGLFLSMQPKSYLLNNTAVFKAISIATNDQNDLVIIALGVNIQFYVARFAIENLVWDDSSKKGSFNGIELISIDGYMHDFLRESFIIIKKADLPNVLKSKLSDAKISKYKLDIINKEEIIYAKILDLNQVEEIRNEISSVNQQVDLKQYCLCCVDFIREVRIRKDAKCIQIKVFYQFNDNGNPNKAEEVQPIWDTNLKNSIKKASSKRSKTKL